jgi:hypothetical protein
MTDEFTLRKATDRAAKAQTVLDSDIVREAFDSLRQGYTNVWLMTDPRDTVGRELCWVARTLVDKVEGHFKTAVTDGKVAMSELNEIDARRTREGAA